MKRILIMAAALNCFSGLLAQQKEADSKTDSDLKMTTEYASDKNALISYCGTIEYIYNNIILNCTHLLLWNNSICIRLNRSHK